MEVRTKQEHVAEAERFESKKRIFKDIIKPSNWEVKETSKILAKSH